MSSAEIPSEGVERAPSKDTGSERGPAARIAARTSLGVFAALQVIPGLVHVFSLDGGASGMAGLELSLFSVEEAAVLVNVLAAVGNAQLFFGLVVGLVAATGALRDLLRLAALLVLVCVYACVLWFARWGLAADAGSLATIVESSWPAAQVWLNFSLALVSLAAAGKALQPISSSAKYFPNRPTFSRPPKKASKPKSEESTEEPDEEEPQTFWEEQGIRGRPEAWTQEEKEEVARMIFAKYDQDESGTIDLDELCVMMVEIDRHLLVFKTPERVFQFANMQLQEADLNMDEVLDEEEFVPFFVERIITQGFEMMAEFDFDAYEERLAHGS
jgi:Ca2+-binding EF-hand superfamily protein